jgi:hypothetical protein
VRAQFLKAILIERPRGVGEHEPFEARFKVPGPIVKCDPLCVVAAVSVELGLDLQLPPMVDSDMGVNLRRRADDPVSDVGTGIPLQLFDAFARRQSDEVTTSTDLNSRSSSSSSGKWLKNLLLNE